MAVHGLNLFNKDDHGEATWRSPKSGKSWLRDFLPEDIPEARTFLYADALMTYQSYKPRHIRPRITVSLNEIVVRLLVISVAVPEAEELETLAVLRTDKLLRCCRP